ncbi:outer membrane protein assembly factor BamD [Candidatus Pantoea edessiphila]|uniref:Outer membrane protein assembly factor BamD n=1 Tax=Candidatus Pantoea edessiphila TaxID=2044610 RepID=A0A2P5T1R2_9GAMM|nr:outer membrane protein assembly factor BamD [Candidatus Pantoea edessiphila]PPI88480.1 outer membrane protein assembly factor BamD [Candidatus Pantoea edessiphila]
MKRIKYLFVTFTLILMIMGCSKFNNISSIPYTDLQKMYSIAQQKMQNGNFVSAIQYLKDISNIDSFGSYSKQAQLDMIYSYYKNKDFISAQILINHFMQIYPESSSMDYLLYIKGLIEMILDNPLKLKVQLDYSSHSMVHAYNAFNDFAKLLHNYPGSDYSVDAYNRLVYLKNRLAKHELSIALFYSKRKAYVAVINRVKKMIKLYPDTQATLDGLVLMQNAYRELKIHNEADKIDKIIAAND